MKKYLSILSAACALGVASGSVHAGDIRDQTSIQTGVAQLVITGVTPQDVAAKVKDAVSQFAIPANLNFRTLPSETPARPDEPTRKQVYVKGTNAIEYHCENAYAEIIKHPPPVNNAFAMFSEGLQACLYNFQGGVKVYLVFTRIKRTESMTSGLFSGIANAIQGTDGERITKMLKENIDSIRKEIPTMLVERIEVPGMQIQEPDKDAVAAIIPPKPPTPVQSPDRAPAAQAPTAVAAAMPAAAPASMQARIEARKSLTGMGMTYHSQEQFAAAIKRKDDVAVQLFIDGGGIDLTAKDANGRTPVDLANDAGAADIAAQISAGIAAKTNAPKTPQTLPAAAPATTQAQPAALAPVSEADVPPDVLAKIDAQLATMNLTDAQKKAYRDNAIRQISQLKAFAARVDPSTGQLR